MTLLANLGNLIGAVMAHARAIREVQQSLADAHAQIRRASWMSDNAVVHGKVTDVDPEKHLYRQEIGEDDEGNPVKSPWLPYSQVAGTRKVHSAPSVGQQMTLLAPGGNIERAISIPLTWWNDNPSPSTSGSEDVDLRGKTRHTQKDGDFKTEIDGVTRQYTKQSAKLVIHKDPENEEEGQGEEVSDKNPWKGNRAKNKHARVVSKDGGYQLTINEGDDEKEHKIFVKPDDNAVEISTHKGKHKITIKKDDLKVSFKNGQHETTYSDAGIKHKSSSKVESEGPEVHHIGETFVTEDLHVAKKTFIQEILEVGGLTKLFGGLSTGALEVAMDDDGGLVEAEFAFRAGGGSFEVDALADGGRCRAAHGLDVSIGGDDAHGIEAGAFKAVAANSFLAGPVVGTPNVPTFRAINGDDLPAPAEDTLGGVLAASAPVHEFMTGIGTDGSPDFAQVNYADLAGSAPIPALSSLSGWASLGDYANDSAAAAGGVAVGKLYRTGSALKVRIA